MASTKHLTQTLKLTCLIAATIWFVHYFRPRRAADHLLSQLVPRRVENASPVRHYWAHQNLQETPPVPILRLSEHFIYAAMSKNTSTFQNATQISKVEGRSHGHFHERFHHDGIPAMLNPLVKRAAEPCGPGKPCADKSCCSKGGKCGYGPNYCKDCISNCNAKAMCGRYSEGGSVKCGMNLCCSYYGWCGTSELHCGNPDKHKKTPCQEKFGLCHTVPPPKCGSGSGSANGRTIGYYQASNTRERLCNRVSPSQIDTDGLTHLYFAFAKIDPKSFAVVPGNSGDTERYTAFNKLQSSSLKTWIAIGGFDFSDPGPTRTTWSDLVSTQGGRSAFITSLKKFMAKYGFQGVDLDWEYPATPERGGKKADTKNFVSLVKEMKAAFGGQYGLSLTLAPDYWYLRGFDAKAMEPYVDMFGFMAYDLHGFWDADLKTLGATVRGQTDIREIYNDTLPLWFDGLNPKKINLGLAYYGRGYTLAKSSCNQLGCPFIGPSAKGPCTDYDGVLSLAEIKGYIAEKGLKPQLLEKAMMKQITWDDQWIGYDDEETIAMKKKWASGYCFGGTMVWSVDFKSGSGSNSEDPQDNAPATKDGKCGKAHGGSVCGGWHEGGCCSASGFCGRGPKFCGNSCQSGPCLRGAESTDGTCGPLHGNSICGSWSGGSCCSASGFCGSSDSHCGASCISGPCKSATKNSGPSGDVYIDPSIWSDHSPIVYCIPPCAFILPPLKLPAATTISFPLFTTSLEVAWKTTTKTTLPNGQVSTSIGFDRITETTTLTIPPMTTNKIDVWNVKITSGASNSKTLVTTSILPPPFTITDDRNPRHQSGVTHPPVTRTITPPPWPYSKPSGMDGPVITFSSASPSKNKGGGGGGCKIGCGHKCLFFCSGPCLLNCVDPPGGFVDPIDPNPPRGRPPPGRPPPGGPDNEESKSRSSCSKKKTATNYYVSCTSLSAGSSSCKTTSSSVYSGCIVKPHTKTASSRSSCPFTKLNPDDDQGDGGNRALATHHQPSATSKPEDAAAAVASILASKPKPKPKKPEPKPSGLLSSANKPKPKPDIEKPEPKASGLLTPENNPKPKPEPKKPPPPPLEKMLYYAGYFQYRDFAHAGGLGTGLNVLYSHWAIFYAPKGKDYDACNGHALWEADDNTHKKPQYPIKSGPFDAEGHTGCVYTREKDDKGPGKGDETPGELNCDHFKGYCHDAAERAAEKTPCELEKFLRYGTWVPQAVCNFYV